MTSEELYREALRNGRGMTITEPDGRVVRIDPGQPQLKPDDETSKETAHQRYLAAFHESYFDDEHDSKIADLKRKAAEVCKVKDKTIADALRKEYGTSGEDLKEILQDQVPNGCRGDEDLS